MPQKFNLARRLVAEFTGTALLLATVIGSGIMGQTLSGGNIAIALLANALATGAILYVLITMFGPISGAHFNPLVSLVFMLRKELASFAAGAYIFAQIFGALIGVVSTHLMFDQPLLQLATQVRTGSAQWFSEGVATFGLVITILLTIKFRAEAVAASVALYIVAAYWFTASTSFANPAVTFARAFSDSFAGIRILDVPAFVVAQIIGAALAMALYQFLLRSGDQK